ncbi:hypothetical protein V2J09_007740 [Rumex salicifolius]
MESCLSSESRTPIPGSPSSSASSNTKRTPRRKSGWTSSFKDEIPGRLFANGATEFASLYTQQGKKGTNQDAMLVWEKFGSRDDTIFCGVFDGHGPYGHMVARRVRDQLPQKLSAHLETTLKNEEVLREISLNTCSKNDMSFVSAEEESRPSVDLNEILKQPDVFQTLKDSFLKVFKVMDRELRVHRIIDCFCSGTTAVTLVKQGEDLVVGNVGDSRAVLGTRDESCSLIAVQLTVDLKPNLPAEAERIRKHRGRVFALRDEPEVSRIWLPNNDSPGLAMARAFGDFCLKDYGLIAVPEVSHRRVTDKDEFVVLATDGIWDVLSNQEAVDIIASAANRDSAAKALVESAVRAWRTKYPTSKVDDCAAICLFLGPDKSSVSSFSCNLTNEKELPISADQDSPSVLPGTVTTVENKDDVPETSDDDLAKDDDDLAQSDTDWSAIEGVTRANTLLTLPAYVPGENNEEASEETTPSL